jgi:hypothetical protein
MADWTVDKTADEGFALPWSAERVSVLKKTVDFSVAANNLVQNGVMSIFKLPAKCIVLACGINVLTVDTDVTDVDLGLYTELADTITTVDIDGYGDGLTLASLGFVQDPNAAYCSDGTEAMHVVAADSYFTIKNIDSDTLNGAEVEFFAVVVDVS